MDHPAPLPLGPPDGGYGWAIVVAVLLQLIFVTPIMPMFGIIFGSKFEEFETTPSQQTSIFALYLISWNVITMFTGPLVQLRSERFVALCSTTLIVSGLILCAFSTSTSDLMIAYGLIVACGYGLGSSNGILILNKYFKKKAGLAFGLMAAGTSLSAQAIPQVVKVLITHLTPRQAILVYASLCSTGYIGAVLMRDVRPLLRPLEGRDLEEHRARLLASPQQEQKKLSKGFCDSFIIFRVFRMINWKLLVNPYFVLIALGSSWVFTCFMSYVPQFRNICQERGLDLGETADILTMVGVCEMVARPTWGFVGDSKLLKSLSKTPRKLVYTIGGLGCSLGLAVLTLTSGFVSHVLVSLFLGLFSAAFLISGPIVYAEAFEQDLASAIGLSNLVRAAMALILGPVIGRLHQLTGSFTAPLLFMSGSIGVIMMAWILADCLCYRRTVNNSSKEEEDQSDIKSTNVNIKK